MKVGEYWKIDPGINTMLIYCTVNGEYWQYIDCVRLKSDILNKYLQHRYEEWFRNTMNTGRYLHYSLKLLNNEKVNPLETNKHHTSITNGILNRPIRGQNAKANHGSCFVLWRTVLLPICFHQWCYCFNVSYWSV